MTGSACPATLVDMGRLKRIHQCKKFLNLDRRQKDDTRVRRFCRSHLLTDIIKTLRARWTDRGGINASHLVTIGSDNPELVVMAVGDSQPDVSLFLYTSDKTARLNEAKELLAQLAVDLAWSAGNIRIWTTCGRGWSMTFTTLFRGSIPSVWCLTLLQEARR
ncbi:MAG: hypothetical protein NZM29_00975 [Nitrospira sp.]|nr:hypothetical protein [Nitrospira sp.]